MPTLRSPRLHLDVLFQIYEKDLRRADQRVNLYDVKAEQVNRSTTKVKTLIGSNNVWRPQHFDCRDLLRLRPNFARSRPKTYSHQALGQYSQLGLLEFLTRRLVKSQKSQVLTIWDPKLRLLIHSRQPITLISTKSWSWQFETQNLGCWFILDSQ
jgi:hypothetical protein